MNVRIKLLAEQCRGNPMTSEFEPLFDKAKFALLLMREIMRVQVSYQAGMDLENKKMDDPAKELNYAVIEHFGVGK